MEVRIAVRWGDGGRGRREEHQFWHVVQVNLLAFSSFLLAGTVSPSSLTSSCFISCPVTVVKGGSLDAVTHILHTGFPEAHLHPTHQGDGSSLYSYNEVLTENLYLSAVMI